MIINVDIVFASHDLESAEVVWKCFPAHTRNSAVKKTSFGPWCYVDMHKAFPHNKQKAKHFNRDEVIKVNRQREN